MRCLPRLGTASGGRTGQPWHCVNVPMVLFVDINGTSAHWAAAARRPSPSTKL